MTSNKMLDNYLTKSICTQVSGMDQENNVTLGVVYFILITAISLVLFENSKLFCFY